MDYIDLLISAASAIYEHEIDTHLHVVEISKTSRYDSATSTTDALSIMRSAFAGSAWHSNDIDLHHALLGKDLGGGIAYVGALCNSNYGFGLSANLSGNFNGLGASTVWDLTVTAHELGHNFGSHHTHSSAYLPPVDTCGSQCPLGDVPDGSSTIMSYCHQCGGMAKVAYTFGGHRDDQGKWIDVQLPGSINTNPSRVAVTMYQHVSSRGTCVLPTHEVPTQECGGKTCNDDNECTIDQCIDDICVSTPITCSDNNVCTLDQCNPNVGCIHSPTEGSSSFELILETDNYGAETSWELFSSGLSELVASGNGYTSSSSFTIQETICNHPCFTFIIKDTWGDGMCCEYGTGGYRILVDGVEIHSGGDFGLQDTVEFCIDESAQGETLEPSASPSTASPTSKSSLAPSESPTPMSSSSPSTSPSQDPSSDPTAMPTKSPTIKAPSAISTPRPSQFPSTSPPTLTPTSQPTSQLGGNWVEIFYNDFEAPNQWGNWVDGLPGDGDARRYGGGVYTHSGLGSIKLRDDSDMASSVFTNDISVSRYQMLRVEFWYYARSMDNPNEDFFLERSIDGGLTWKVVNSWARSIDFENDRWYFVVQDFDSSAISAIRLRFRCDASGNGDNIFIDDVKFSGLE